MDIRTKCPAPAQYLCDDTLRRVGFLFGRRECAIVTIFLLSACEEKAELYRGISWQTRLDCFVPGKLFQASPEPTLVEHFKVRLNASKMLNYFFCRKMPSPEISNWRLPIPGSSKIWRQNLKPMDTSGWWLWDTPFVVVPRHSTLWHSA